MPRKPSTKKSAEQSKGVSGRATRAQTPWSVAEAKAHLSTVLEKARTEGPQTITRNGRKTAVVVGIEEWERKTKRKGTLADFLMNSPLRGSDIDLERVHGKPRDIEL